MTKKILSRKNIIIFIAVTAAVIFFAAICLFITLFKKEETTLTGTDAYSDRSGNNVNYICGIDSYGRVFKPISGWKKDKDVGMFYFLWHGDSGKNTLDVTKLLENDSETLWNTDINTNEFHYWGEPLFGYYCSWDKWVISRHTEMLIAAGIDYLVFDVTNGPTYVRAYTAVCDVLTDYQNQGWDVPKIVFYTNSSSLSVMRNVYESIYEKGLYKSLWYCPSGDKPMIIGNSSDGEETEFLEFFDLRPSQWPNEPYKTDGIPWMDWDYPQKSHRGFMNVSVAQHPQLPFSDSILNRALNRGRGYSVEAKENIEEDSRKGTNFQSQWDTVIQNRDSIDNVFVTGWNEWIAQKLIMNGRVWFVDCATEEFSRDIEPMKGGYEDSFYLQLCDNVRRYKGNNDEIMKPDTDTIDIYGDISQWNGIRNIYTAITENVIKRNSTSVDGKIKYTVEPARNNIQSVKITNDKKNLYFLISCEHDAVKTDSSDFMNIYLGAGDLELVGWEGYEYVISCGDKALYTLDNSGNRKKTADVDVSVNGGYIQVSAPIDTLVGEKETGIYFKLTDGISSTDIMDTYLCDKSLPLGRLSYYYFFG